MKLNWTVIALIVGILANISAVFYWGGVTSAQVEAVSAAVTQETAQQRIEHAEFRAQISELQQRQSRTEGRLNGPSE
jgi:Tfp pilus assembly protein PilE